MNAEVMKAAFIGAIAGGRGMDEMPRHIQKAMTIQIPNLSHRTILAAMETNKQLQDEEEAKAVKMEVVQLRKHYLMAAEEFHEMVDFNGLPDATWENDKLPVLAVFPNLARLVMTQLNPQRLKELKKAVEAQGNKLHQLPGLPGN